MEQAELKDENEEIQLAPQDESARIADPNARIRYGEDAFSNITPLCEVACIITTPTKKVLKFRTRYIGMHSNNVILLESPKITPKELAVFLQRGYALQACVISAKGEGARVYFKSKIEYVLNGGATGLLLITLPKATQVVVGLRESARLELSIDAVIDPQGQRYLGQIRDISQSGCLIVIDRAFSHYRVGNEIELTISTGDESNPERLKAVVKNVAQSSQYKKYGVQFEESSSEHAKRLIERLNFCQEEQKFAL